MQGKVVFAAHFRVQADCCELTAVATAEKYRGQGIARAVLQQWFDPVLAAAGAVHMVLGAMDAGAVDSWRALGFKPMPDWELESCKVSPQPNPCKVAVAGNGGCVEMPSQCCSSTSIRN